MTQPGRYEYRTVPITAAALCRSRRMARRRERELEAIDEQGWEVVSIAAGNAGSTKDYATLRRPVGHQQPRPTRAPTWWEQLEDYVLRPGYLKALLRRLRR